MTSSASADDHLADVPPGWFDHLFRHKVKGFLFFIVAMLLVVVFTQTSPLWYRSEGALYFRLGRENVALDPTTAVGQSAVLTNPGSREREINSILEIIKSRGLIETLIDVVGAEEILRSARGENNLDMERQGLAVRLGLKPPLSQHERAVQHLTRRLEVESAEESNIIWLAYEARTPEAAQLLVETLMNCYLEKHVEYHRISTSLSFLTQQTDQSKQRLAALEESLSEAKKRTLLVSPAEQRRALVNQAAHLELTLLENEATEESLARQAEKLQAMLEEIPKQRVTARTTGISNAAADQMRDRLYSLQMLAQDLLSRQTESHPRVTAVRQQITDSQAILEAEDDLRTQITEGIHTAYEAGEISLLNLLPLLELHRQKSVALRQRLQQTQEQLRALNERELEIARLQRDVQLADVEYRQFVAALDRARLDEALEMERISNVNVVQAATLSSVPSRPIWMLNLAIGFVLASLGSWSFTGLVDAWRQSSPAAAPRRRVAGEVSSPARPTTA